MSDSNTPAETKKKEKKTGMWANLERIILIVGFGIFIGSIFLPPSFRDALAMGVNVIVAPFFSTMPFYMAVLVIAIIVTWFSTVIQKYTMDWELMRRVTERARTLQKEMREAQLSGNKAKLKKLQEEQMTMMEDQAEMSKQQLKPMGYIVFVSIPLFWWAFWYLTTQQPHLAMIFPMLNNNQPILLSSVFLIFPYWVVWSMICSLAVSQVVRKALNTGMPM